MVRLLVRWTLTALFSSTPLLFVHRSRSFIRRNPHLSRRHGCWSVSKSCPLVRTQCIHETPPRFLHRPTFSQLNENVDPRKLTQDAFMKLAKSGRSWNRLRHLVDLACVGDDDEQIRTIADVGCDHGLLAISLSLSGRFERIVGVDISERALQDGAIALHKQLLDTLNKEGRLQSVLPVDFRVGDGLKALQSGEGDALCIAGMGVDSMIRIVEPSEIDRVGCRKLILQPTSPRPRNLLRLYDSLSVMGWGVTNERIEYLSSRWYISASFAPQTMDENRPVPGQMLARLSDESSMKKAYGDYVRHHRKWIEQNAKSGPVPENDKRWLAEIRKECV